MSEGTQTVSEPGNADFDIGAGLASVRAELADQLPALVEFWRSRAIDTAGGYHTCFDADGHRTGRPEEKYLVTQCRLVWAFSEFADVTGDRGLLDLAGHGVDYLTDVFHDQRYGGWFWKADGGRRVIDDAKITYGQSFAVYALAAYGRIAADAAVTRAAANTFDQLQVAAADTEHGGYHENFARDWSTVDTTDAVRKTLDTHMHLLESFTELVRATGDATHRRRLVDIRDLLLDRMIDPSSGAGGNQFAADFTPLEPAVLPRTWIAERTGTAAPSSAATSYGHNLELAWLLIRADEILGARPHRCRPEVVGLAAHAVRFGLDRAYGGVFREGPFDGPATDRDKEFWQNSEALVGFLSAYRSTGNRIYYDAFLATWRFARAYFIHPRLGKWRVRTTDDGRVIDGDLGNEWKVCYHTGRAAMECLEMLDTIIEPSDDIPTSSVRSEV